MAHALYTQLKNDEPYFRLIRLRPDVNKTEIRCELFVTRIDESPDYEALSYVWTEPSLAGIPRGMIQVNDQEVEVTVNLLLALAYLRYEDRERLVWVDALCIDQSNLQEKSQQIPLMHQIYANASCVIAWLGGEASGTPAQMEILSSHLKDPELPLFINADDDEEIFKKRKESIQILTFFFKRQWWTRVWTVQEAVAAKRLIFVMGSYVIPEEDVTRLWEAFDTQSRRGGSKRQKLDFLMFLPEDGAFEDHGDPSRALGDALYHYQRIIDLRKAEKKPSFLELAAFFRLRHATDLRDKIYGFLGVADGLPSTIVDYHQSIPEVFERSTVELITRTGTLDVFSQILPPPNFHLMPPEVMKHVIYPLIPSWVPDWTLRLHPSVVRCHCERLKFLDLYKAGTAANLDIHHLGSGRLALQGVHFDTIAQVGKPCGPYLRDIHQWRSMIEVDKHPDKPYPGGGTLLNAFWRTLCANVSTFKGFHARAQLEDRQLHDAWWWTMIASMYQPGVQSSFTKDERYNVRVLESSLLYATNGRTFFVSTKGYVGLAPSRAEVGDRVVVFLGAKMPHILRNKSSATDYNDEAYPVCRLLGDSYVHGLMDGEALQHLKEKSATLHTFILE